MSSTRIKNLQSASPLIEKHFNEMEFIVDVANPDSTLKLTGRELREAVGLKSHIHPIEEVDGLAGELEKKLDKAGGTMTGDLVVQGNARMKSLTIEEYLEVPEFKYNRITATGSEFWVTDAGIIDDWYSVDGVYCITLKAKESETTIGFEVKDILRGVFHTTDANGKPAGFSTAYFEVTAVFDSENFDCISLNDVPPARFMALVRQGNKNNVRRQGSVYLDGQGKQIKVLDGVKDETITLKNTKVLLGDLSDIDHPTFGQLAGFGALLENAYISGRLVQKNAETGEEWAVGAVSVTGEQVFHYDSMGYVDKEVVVLLATEQGFRSVESERSWQYRLEDKWIDMEKEHSLTLSQRHDADCWHDRKVIALRYWVQSAGSIYSDVITISKVYDGEKGEVGAASITMSGFTSPGYQFYREGQSYEAMLWVELFRGDACITHTINPSRLVWERFSENPEGDVVWNELHAIIGNLLIITEGDLVGDTAFSCSYYDHTSTSLSERSPMLQVKFN